jgi:hypothetical protein
LPLDWSTARYPTDGFLFRLPEQPSEESAACLLDRGGIPSFASALDLDRILGPPVGLVELASLSVAEHDPVADVVSVGQWSAGYTLEASYQG